MNKDSLLLQTLPSEEISLSSGEEEANDEEIDIDEFFVRGGEFGRFQMRIIVLLLLSTLPMVYPVMIFYYIGHDPSWSCTKNNISTSSKSICNVVNGSTMFSHENTARCSLNRSEWKYEYHGKTSVSTEFELICNHASLDALVGSILFIGWGIGGICMGILSDRYGRKTVMYPALFMMILCLALHAAASNIWQLLVIRFFMGFFYSAPALNRLIIAVETVGPNRRVLAAAILFLLWPVNSIVLTVKAYYIDNWRNLALVCSVPYFIVLLTVFGIPESVRWLHVKGRTTEAETILNKAARINKKKLPPLFLKATYSNGDGTVKKVSYIDLFRTCSRVKLVLAQGFLWFTAGMTYYGLNWAFADLGGDMYVNFVLSSLVEIPGVFMSVPILGRFGRKKTALVSYVCTTLACFGVACTPNIDELKDHPPWTKDTVKYLETALNHHDYRTIFFSYLLSREMEILLSDDNERK